MAIMFLWQLCSLFLKHVRRKVRGKERLRDRGREISFPLGESSKNIFKSFPLSLD